MISGARPPIDGVRKPKQESPKRRIPRNNQHRQEDSKYEEDQCREDPADKCSPVEPAKGDCEDAIVRKRVGPTEATHRHNKRRQYEQQRKDENVAKSGS